MADHELSLQEAYNYLCEEVVKLKKLNKKQYKKLTAVENEKSNLSEALKISKIEVSRLHAQQGVLEKELKKIQECKEKNTTQKLDEMLSFQKSRCDRTGLRYMTSQCMEFKASSSTATSSKGIIFVKGNQDEEAPKKALSKTHVSRASHDRPMTKKHNQGKSKGKFITTCYHCGILGHIKLRFNLNKV